MATNDPAYPPSSEPGSLPYPTTDTASAPGVLPYPPTTDTASAPGVLPYPPTTDSNPPAYPPAGSAPYPPPQIDMAKSGTNENKTYTDAPPPYSPPPGGVYPTSSQGQVPPPQPGFVGYPNAQPMPSSYTVAPGTVTVTTVHRSGQQQVMVRQGACPTCRSGMISENFTLLGICCAFWFFPLGIFCCLAMREKRCTSCGAAFA